MRNIAYINKGVYKTLKGGVTMKNVTIVTTEDVKNVLKNEYFLTPEMDENIQVSRCSYSAFGWEDRDSEDMEEINVLLDDLSAMDIEYLYIAESKDEILIGGNDYKSIFSWYKDYEGLFSAKQDKVVLIRDLDNGDILSTTLVNQEGDPLNAIETVKNNVEDWDVESILKEWRKEEFFVEYEVEEFFV